MSNFDFTELWQTIEILCLGEKLRIRHEEWMHCPKGRWIYRMVPNVGKICCNFTAHVVPSFALHVWTMDAYSPFSVMGSQLAAFTGWSQKVIVLACECHETSLLKKKKSRFNIFEQSAYCKPLQHCEITVNGKYNPIGTQVRTNF